MPVQVALGLLRDDRGRLLVLRGVESPLAGLWHFPGGKLEVGEDGQAAMRRELREELGVEAGSARFLWALRYRYPKRPELRLQAWLVENWNGQPRPGRDLECRWEDPVQLRGLPIPPPNRAILAALLLPPLYLVTPDIVADAVAGAMGRTEEAGTIQETGAGIGWSTEQEFEKGLQASLELGTGLVQLRCDGLTLRRYESLARRVSSLCRAASALLLLNRGEPGCVPGYADGLHLKSARLRQKGIRRARPRSGDRSWISASCHNLEELRAAAWVGADCALLGPVRATPTHPEARALGWEAFARLASQSDLPVYALGGLGSADLDQARAAGAHGVAALRALWPGP